MSQYKLFEDIEDYYVDQSAFSSEFADRCISSFYTPYGIKCIDSQYSFLIQNMDQCATVYKIKREIEKYIDFKGVECEGIHYVDKYEPIPSDYDSRCGYGFRIIYDDGNTKDFFYGKRPIFGSDRKIDVEQLITDIKNDAHLHVMIKENLLQNIENYEKYSN